MIPNASPLPIQLLRGLAPSPRRLIDKVCRWKGLLISQIFMPSFGPDACTVLPEVERMPLATAYLPRRSVWTAELDETHCGQLLIRLSIKPSRLHVCGGT